MKTEDITFLATRVELLAGWDPERLAALAEASRVEFHEAGELIVVAGSEVHSLGIVLEGEIVARAPAPGGESEELGRFGAGDTFGEMALMTGERARVEMVAVGPCRVMHVPLTLLRSQVMADPAMVQKVSRVIGERFQRLLGDPRKAAAVSRGGEAEEWLELKSERHQTILVINCGSSSLKWCLFDSERPQAVARGLVERIGVPGTRLRQSGDKGELVRELPAGGHGEAFAAMVVALTDPAAGVIREAGEISVVGHRVVHGGEKFAGPVVIDDHVMDAIGALSPLAPLHNPVNVTGIREARRVFAAVPHVAVFDTAFHATLPSHAYLYGLPYDLYVERGVRRYGFHGMSHAYVGLAAARFLGRPWNELEIVSCHLGNGASLCAIEHGRSIDTTMGFTPGEGLIMGTRCGDLDAGVVTFLQREAGMSAADVDELLNKRSGLLGISGISGDMREIEAAADAGHARALVAMKAFCYRVRKAIGASVAAMGGLDVLAFTGGIGQGSAGVRATALQGLSCMGIRLDEARNREADGKGGIEIISAADSPVTVLVVPSDEERMIARETLRALSRDFLARASVARRDDPIPIEISAHHIHLCQEHVEALFGEGHQLTRHADLSQPGQFACKEQLTIVGPKGRIERVRVLGPVRKATQVEISMTEQFKLGIHPPIRESGDIAGTPGCTLEGPAGSVTIEHGVICALRHVHMTPADALRYGVKDKDDVRVRVTGDREMIFGDVRVRVSPTYALAMHVDTDEANAANLRPDARGFLEDVQG